VQAMKKEDAELKIKLETQAKADRELRALASKFPEMNKQESSPA